jgi:hypothetical protein
VLGQAAITGCELCAVPHLARVHGHLVAFAIGKALMDISPVAAEGHRGCRPGCDFGRRRHESDSGRLNYTLTLICMINLMGMFTTIGLSSIGR